MVTESPVTVFAVAVSVAPIFKDPEIVALSIVGATITVKAPALVALPPPLFTTKS